jgi:hypothetical protein
LIHLRAINHVSGVMPAWDGRRLCWIDGKAQGVRMSRSHYIVV